nr:hypothetical protein CFP56_57568 [Quercus suber]
MTVSENARVYQDPACFENLPFERCMSSASHSLRVTSKPFRSLRQVDTIVTVFAYSARRCYPLDRLTVSCALYQVLKHFWPFR